MLFRGGYVGVDVFFVISGFLITSILLPDAHDGRLRLGLFYERRIRRIFPALFAVLLACLVASCLLLLPLQFVTFARSAIATTLFASNFFFWTQSGYFAQLSNFVPLLHTWSLAVEEQFYIVFPVCLYVALKLFKTKVPVAVGATIIAFFAVAEWATILHPTGAFYFAPSRAWEFLVGSFLALDSLPKLTSRPVREAISALGAGLVIWSIFTFTEDTAFPGTNALFPCLGAFLIMYAGMAGSSLVSDVLESKPLVWVGLISYSLYLWHWPILVFCHQYLAPADLGLKTTIGAVAASLLLSSLSWRYIEQPFRRPGKIGPRVIFSLAGASVVATVAMTSGVVASAGLSGRFTHEVAEIESGSQDRDPRFQRCLNGDISDVIKTGSCNIGVVTSRAPRFVLWGDSHASALLPSLEASAKRYATAGVLMALRGCPPLLGITFATRLKGTECRNFDSLTLNYIESAPSVQTVFLAGRWAEYSEGVVYKRKPDKTHFEAIEDDQTTLLSPAENRRVFDRALKRTVAALKRAGKRVVVVGPVPEVGVEVPTVVAMERLKGVTDRVAPTMQQFMERQAFVLREIQHLAKQPEVTAVYPHKVLCGKGLCDIVDGTRTLYIDTDHLSVYGAHKISTLFDSAMRAIGEKAGRSNGRVVIDH